jgi:Monooxygenase af470-like
MTVVSGRMMAEIDGDFVVFLVGMRVNRWWKVHKWWPVASAMSRILRELAARPECGCLASVAGFGTIIQYWRSFDHLEAYARSQDHAHWPAWTAFNRKVRASSGDVGIWHETFLVRAGEYETLYGSMPRHGLARAGRHVPIGPGRDGARERLWHAAAPETR